MKKSMVYTITALLLLSALVGCGRMENKDETKKPTELPEIVVSPGVSTPDPEDGFVRDDDGIITDDDTGRMTSGPVATTNPGASAVPAASNAPAASASPGTRTASPNPSADTKSGMQ